MMDSCIAKAQVSHNCPRLCPLHPKGTGMADLRWLVRYAKQYQLQSGDEQSMHELLRAKFGAAAWRVVCKSPKSHFMPILRNREFNLESLITYCKRLAQKSFVQAPAPILLAYFITQRRSFYDRSCQVPVGEDYDVMRVAERHIRHTGPISLHELACVVNWAHQSGMAIQSAHRWHTLVIRSRKYFELERVKISSQRHSPWHFFCSDTHWRGWQISPLADACALWHQGQIHGNCLYKLRRDCIGHKPSRFFSIGRAGKNMATLELVWQMPQDSFTGTDRLWGKWVVQDLRLSFNRQPDLALLESMQAFAQMYNNWSQRPGRHPPGYANRLRQHIAGLQNRTEPLQASTHPSGLNLNLSRARGSQYM